MIYFCNKRKGLKVVKSVSDDNFQRLMDKANSVNARIDDLLRKKAEVRAKLDAAMSKGSSSGSTSSHSTSASGGTPDNSAQTDKTD